MIWRIVAKGEGRHEVVAEGAGGKHSCGITTDPMCDIEAFVFEHAKPNDTVKYPDGRVCRISGMVFA